MNSQRCSICLGAVSTRPDMADQSVPNNDGGLDHWACVHAGDPEDRLLRAVFGTVHRPRVRENNATQGMAEQLGHHARRVKASDVDDDKWSAECSCGWALTAVVSGHDAKAAVWSHRKDAAVYG